MNEIWCNRNVSFYKWISQDIKTGTLKLVGTDEEMIYSEFKTLLTNKDKYNKMSKASNP